MRITPNNPASHYIRVWLNGKEITQDCFFADLSVFPFLPNWGIIGLYGRDENGKRFVDEFAYGDDPNERHPAREYRRGITWWRWSEHARNHNRLVLWRQLFAHRRKRRD